MEITLFVVFLALALILIILGLYRTEHSELSLVGFVFLFLLALNLEIGVIQYKTGENYTYSCLCCDPQGELGVIPCFDTNASLTKIASTNSYTTWDGGGTLAHIVGYWTMIASIIGFIGVLLGFKKAKEFNGQH